MIVPWLWDQGLWWQSLGAIILSPPLRCHQQPVSRHIIRPKLYPLSRRDKMEDWTFEESKTRIWIELWRETNSNVFFRGGEKIQLTAPCWPRVPTSVQCGVSTSGRTRVLCHCWGRGQNFPHYRQNYFPNTLISTCPALILLLKSDKSSQMLHCTVQNRSLSWKHPENCWAVSRSAHETNNKQSPPIQRSVQWRSCSQSRHYSIHGFGNKLCIP